MIYQPPWFGKLSGDFNLNKHKGLEWLFKAVESYSKKQGILDVNQDRVNYVQPQQQLTAFDIYCYLTSTINSLLRKIGNGAKTVYFGNRMKGVKSNIPKKASLAHNRMMGILLTSRHKATQRS